MRGLIRWIRGTPVEVDCRERAGGVILGHRKETDEFGIYAGKQGGRAEASILLGDRKRTLQILEGWVMLLRDGWPLPTDEIPKDHKHVWPPEGGPPGPMRCGICGQVRDGEGDGAPEGPTQG